MNTENKIRIIKSTSNNPWYNLALEECLLNNIQENQVILYLWQNKDCVVIGRNQNPWKECRWNDMKAEGIKLARRLSGGGAVYHDLGNLNFTFLVDKKDYDLVKQLSVVLKAVRDQNINAEYTGRNDIVSDNKKFSGNAFYFNDMGALHHGTILINANFELLSKYLQVSKEKIISKGIESVKSRVVNLKEINPFVTVEKIEGSLMDAFIEIYSNKEIVTTIEYINPEDTDSSIVYSDEIKNLYNKYCSWKWIFGDSPKFDLNIEKRFPWGNIDMEVSLKKGIIDNIKVYSDSLEQNLILELSEILRNVPLKTDNIIKTIDEQMKCFNQVIISDIKNWLYQKLSEL